MGIEWPQGFTHFRDRCKRSFLNNKDLNDSTAVEKCLQRGEYVIKEIEALYKLKKYRALKRRYYKD